MSRFIKNKQLISSLLLIAMMFTLIPIDVLAINNEGLRGNNKSNEDLVFEYEDEEETILINAINTGSIVEIPKNVRIIKDSVFKGKDIEKLILNEGLIEIGNEVFTSNRISGSIILPSTLKKVGSLAFADNNITTVDFSKTKYLEVGESAFQDNKIEGSIDLSNLTRISRRSFANNEIEDVVLSNELEYIEDEAFINNNLSKVYITSNNVKLGEDVFAGNGKYIILKGNNLNSEKSKYHNYGHITNPANIVIRSLEPILDDNGKETGEYKRVLKDKQIKFNQYDADTFVSLNEKSSHIPDVLFGYDLDDTKHPEKEVVFTPNKDNFVVDIFYKKKPGPRFELNKEAMDSLLEEKVKGSNISKDELLSLVNAFDSKGNDLSDQIIVSPAEIYNAEQKEYKITYSITEDSYRTTSYSISLPVSINPLDIEIEKTGWILRDFTYDKNKLSGLSDSGRIKAETLGVVAVPHINPYTMEPIEVVEVSQRRFNNFFKKSGPIVFGNPDSIRVIKNSAFKFENIKLTGELPDFENLEILEGEAFAENKLSGNIPNMPKIEYIGDEAFRLNNEISGQLLDMAKLKHLGDSAFDGTNLSGQLPEMPLIEHIGAYAFHNTNISGLFPIANDLKYIGDGAFAYTNISRLPESLPKLEYIGDEAFVAVATLRGTMSNMPNLKYIGAKSFTESNIENFPKSFENLEIIEENAFYATKNINGNLPAMPKLTKIGENAFAESSFRGFPAQFESLERIETQAFMNTSNIDTGMFAAPNLKSIGISAFSKSSITSLPEEFPNLEEIEQFAFQDTSSIMNGISKMPNVKYIGSTAFMGAGVTHFPKTFPELEVIGSSAFSGITVSGTLPELPNIKTLGSSVFQNIKGLEGQIPELPRLETMGTNVFNGISVSGAFPDLPNATKIGNTIILGTNIDHTEPIHLGNANVEIDANTFQLSGSERKVFTLFTKNNAAAPNIAISDYHILNPKSIIFIGKNSSGEEIVSPRRITVAESGENYTFRTPSVGGYVTEEISVNKNTLVNNTLEYKYKSYKELINEGPGSRYGFEFKLNGDIVQEAKTKISAEITLSTKNEEILRDGVIELNYNRDIFEEFAIVKGEGVYDAYEDQSTGSYKIILDKSLSQGIELSIPISFKIKPGILPEKVFAIDALLLSKPDNKEDKAYAHDDIYVATTYLKPEYESNISGKYKNFEEIIFKDPSNDNYASEISIHPRVIHLIRDFNEFKIEYKKPTYMDNEGNFNNPKLTSNKWEETDSSYIYKLTDVSGSISIPPLTLMFENPFNRRDIRIESVVSADVITDDEKYKKVEMRDINTLKFNVVEEANQITTLDITKPHFNGKEAYFYNNEELKNTFEWNITHTTSNPVKQLTLKSFELDQRMKYTEINPNGNRVAIKLLDKDGSILSYNVVTEKYQIPKDLQEKVHEVELGYFNIERGITVRPIIGTEIKDPNNITVYSIPEKNFMNKKLSSTSVHTVGSTTFNTVDASIRLMNSKLKLGSIINIEKDNENLIYGKTAVNTFRLKSQDYGERVYDDFKYTVIVNPGHRLEQVIFNENKGKYEVSRTPNGYLRIDFTFKNFKFENDISKEYVDLFTIHTTPEDKTTDHLELYGLLPLSDEYSTYDRGQGVIDGIDLSLFQYEQAIEIINKNNSFFVQNLVGQNNFIGKELTTGQGESFFYRIEIDNSTSVDRNNFELIKYLPYSNDQYGSSYQNTIDLEQVKNIVLPDGFKIEYLNKTYPALPDITMAIDELSNDSWSSTPATNTVAVRLTAPKLSAKSGLRRIDIPMKTKGVLEAYQFLKPNISQFAYKYDGIDTSISNKVVQKGFVDLGVKDIELTLASKFEGSEDGYIEGVNFQIFDAEDEIVFADKTNSNGKIVFKDIPIGDYRIEQVALNPGYKGEKAVINITSEDMQNAGLALVLDKVFNDRVDIFNVFVQNVEVLRDLEALNHNSIKNLYTRGIRGGQFKLTNSTTKETRNIDINDRDGETISFKAGDYELQQIIPAIDNGLTYKLNNIKYKFRIDKYGDLYINNGYGGDFSRPIKQQSNILHIPNTADYKTSLVRINVMSGDKSDIPVSGAVFELINIESGEVIRETTNNNGELVMADIKPGIYNLKQFKSPEGYVSSNRLETIEIPANKEREFSFNYINNKLVININKYKTIAQKIESKSVADEIAADTKSLSGGNIIVEEISLNNYEVREVWEGNKLNINGDIYRTDAQGSVVLTDNVSENDILNILNNDHIPGHYEPADITEYIRDYVSKDGFDGVINIDIEVKPLKGSIYVSKYILDENEELASKEESLTNGATYKLQALIDGEYKDLETKIIDNKNYTVFKDLNPLYRYRVVEVSVPEGQEPAAVKEYDVILNEYNRYTTSVIFRNIVELAAGKVSLKAIDGITNNALEGTKYRITTRNGESKVYTTDENGDIEFEELRHDLAPFTIKQVEASKGYRVSSEEITVTSEDIAEEREFLVRHYQYNETPDTGTSGKLPFFLISLPLVILAYVFNKKKY